VPVDQVAQPGLGGDELDGDDGDQRQAEPQPEAF
jgi:hypothetical protein